MAGIAVCRAKEKSDFFTRPNCTIQAPERGYVLQQRILANGTLQIIYTCNEGYDTWDRVVATCTPDGWNIPVPKCVRYRMVRLYDAPIFNHIQPVKVLEDQDVEELKKQLPWNHDAPRYSRDTLKTLKGRTDVSKKRRKGPDEGRKKRKKEKSLSKLSAARRLNETALSQLDVSCFSKIFGKPIVSAPFIEHAVPVKYARRKNVLPPYNRYLVAVYECADGYVFQDSTTDRLFCSKSAWLGRRPKCVKNGSKQPSINQVKRCAQARGECEHVCEDTPIGIKCSCFDGFRTEGSSCIDVDECAEGTARCSHICRNEAGSYSCDCQPGFHVGTDGRSCHG